MRGSDRPLQARQLRCQVGLATALAGSLPLAAHIHGEERRRNTTCIPNDQPAIPRTSVVAEDLPDGARALPGQKSYGRSLFPVTLRLPLAPLARGCPSDRRRAVFVPTCPRARNAIRNRDLGRRSFQKKKTPPARLSLRTGSIEFNVAVSRSEIGTGVTQTT